nr:hypothetical protein [Tanacetum cinerariifolium]
MVTPVEKRSRNKFCEFHNDKGHSTDECMQLKKQIEELVQVDKLSHLIKEIKQRRDQSKVGKKEALTKDKSTEIYIIQSWQRMTRQKVTQSFERVREITFPSLATISGTKVPLVIEAEIGGHMIQRMYVDGGFSTKALGNNRRRRSFYKSMDEFHDCKVIITVQWHHWKTWNKEIQVVPSIAHRMLKFPADGGIVTIHNTILIPAECTTVITSSKEIPKEAGVRHENFKVALHPNFPDQEVAIGGTLSVKGHTELCSLLKENMAIFAWQPSDMTRAIQAEVQKLVEAGIMREAYYHDWLSNPVMVKKHDGSWRMCVDFTDLNKACPHPLPEIDRKVESFFAYPFKYFLDAYKGYHQIQLAESNEEKTAFHTGQGVYCYTKMPFGLKNAGATYQRLVDKAFNSQIARNIEVFLSKSTEKSLPLFKILKKCIKKSDFHWTSKVEQAFKQLKQHLSELPQLVAPKPKEELIVYMSASYEAISTVLMTERGMVQTSVYFVSRALQGPELNYIPMEKLVLSLVFAAKRLRRYFQAHPIAVIIEQPIKQIMSHPKTLFTDGSSCVDGSGVGLILTSPEGTEFTYALRFQFTASNNEDEYEALIAGLRIASQMGVRNVHEVTIVVEEDGPTWITQIIEYLKEGTLPGDKKEASKLHIKARQYELLEGVLYRQSFLTPWLRCVGPLQVDYVIREIHEGSCSMHAGPWSVVAKAIRLGYYWPTIHRDARDMIQACNDYQIHRKVKFLIVSLDYFTKWIEAKAVATITEIGMPTYRTAAVDTVHNVEELRLNLDLLEERRERDAIREAKAKLKMTKYYNPRVRDFTFRPDDFVYHSNDASHAVDGGKLGPKWEGPYEVTKALGDGAYKLRSTDGMVLPRMWNVANLKKCYL